MIYFSHDVDARSSPKLIKVRIKYGLEGYAVYWICNEYIASEMKEGCAEEDCVLHADLEVLEYDLKIPQKRIKEILEYFVEINLLIKTKDGKYCNPKLHKRKSEALKRQERRHKNTYDHPRQTSGPDNDRTMTGHRVVNVRVKERKGNEIKGKERKPFLKPSNQATKDKSETAGPTLGSKSSKKQHSPLLREI